MDIELNELSLKDLKALQARVEKAIETYTERQKRDAIVELEARARDLGFSLNELLTVKPAKKPRAAAAPKYANPADPSQTWSGRGRPPGWFSEAIAEGKTEADM